MLTDEMKAQGWVEHDGKTNPFKGKTPQWLGLIFATADGGVSQTIGRSDMYDTCWKWARRWWRPERPVKIIAYKPEQPNG